MSTISGNLELGNTNGQKGKWAHVTATNPCPKCEKADWCSISPDGAFLCCRRTAEGGEERTDSAGAIFYLHRLKDSPNGHAWPEPLFTLADGNGQRADPDTLNAVYSALLAKLPLHANHVENLETRGLKRDRNATSPAAHPIPFRLAAGYPAGYRTLGKDRLAAVQSLIAAGMEKSLPRVPGFVVKEKDGRRYWTVAGWGGLLIPVRDVKGRIVAILMRKDEGQTGSKYTYLSSKKHGGPGPGAPVHVPLNRPANSATVRVTEGALKADVATALSGMLTIGSPGVSAWRRAAPLLRELGATNARLALDADAVKNLAVAEALARLADHLASEGFIVELETWPLADGKGIDDLLAAGKTPAAVITGDAVAPAIAEIVGAVREANPSATATGFAASERGAAPEDYTDPHGIAGRFLATHTHPARCRLAFHREQFWAWLGTRWAEKPDAEIRGQLAAFCKRDIAARFVPTKDRAMMPKVTTGLVSNVMQALSGEVMLPSNVERPVWWDGKAWTPRNLIALENGLLDLDAFFAGKTDVLLPHTPCWFSPSSLPYPFDPDADCPRWLAFLNRNLEADVERIALLQEWFGLCVVFDTTRQKFLVLEGEGANGKSVVCAALEAMLVQIESRPCPPGSVRRAIPVDADDRQAGQHRGGSRRARQGRRRLLEGVHVRRPDATRPKTQGADSSDADGPADSRHKQPAPVLRPERRVVATHDADALACRDCERRSRPGIRHGQGRVVGIVRGVAGNFQLGACRP